MRRPALLASPLAALAVATAVAAQDEPIPVRDCSTRAEPTRGKLRFVTANDVVLCPLSFTSLQDARSRASLQRKNGRWFRKSAVKLLYGCYPLEVRVDRGRKILLGAALC